MKFRRRKKKSKKKNEAEESKENEEADVTLDQQMSTDSASGDACPAMLPAETFDGEPPETPDSAPDTPTFEEPPETPVTANGDMKVGTPMATPTAETPPTVTIKTPPTERKSSKLSAFSRIFKPWKWRRRKKPSEKIRKTAVDLERKISVRTSREELIKRGVLKEVDDNGQIIYREAIPEEDYDDDTQEAVKDPDSDYKQANGSAATTPTMGPHGTDGYLPNNVGEDDSLPQTPPPSDHSISLSPDYHHHQRPLSSPIQQSDKMSYDEMHRPESMMVEPKQIRVILPMDNVDRQVPVMHKIPVIHDTSANDKPHLPTYMHNTPPAVSMASHHSHHPGSQSPMTLNNNTMYTPTGLTYPTPTLKGQQAPYSPTTPSGPPPRGTPLVDEVVIRDPDLSQKPLRSAFKGSKSKEMLQHQLQQKLQQRQMVLGGDHDSFHGGGVSFKGHNGSLSRSGGVPPKVAPKPRVNLVNAARVAELNKENAEYYDNIPDYDNLNSDSDEDVQYDPRERESMLAARLARTDSLARFLSQRPERRILLERNIIPTASAHQQQMDKTNIRNRLTRRLSLRPTAEELEHRNILHSQTYEEYMRDKEEKKKTLIRKLSFRPTVDELKEKKIIKFNDYYEVTDASEYDRRADKPWTRLTPRDKAAIRKELNEFKSTEMDVHDESRHLTRFHRP